MCFRRAIWKVRREAGHNHQMIAIFANPVAADQRTILADERTNLDHSRMGSENRHNVANMTG